MAGKQIGIGAKRKQPPSLPSLDLDRPYPMNLRELGFVVIINNLRSQIPDTAADVQALKAALETVGFRVKCYDDCNTQDMKKIKTWASNNEVHQDSNSFGLVILCQKINQGWILDRYQRRAFTIEQLASGLSGVKTLQRKPKFMVIQEARDNGETEEIPILDDKEDFYIISTSCQSDSSGNSYVRELAAVLEQHFMEEPLGTIFRMTKQNITAPKQVPSDLEGSELMTLAGRISSTAMQIIAVQKLGFDISEVKTLSSANREDQWMMKFELLDRWKNKNRINSRQKLAGLLLEVSTVEGIIDANIVNKVLKTGDAGNLSIREFDSFTHVLHFSEFYREKTPEVETPATMEFNIHPEVALQLDQMRLQLAKVSEEASKTSELERKLLEQEEKLKQIHAKEAEELRAAEMSEKVKYQEEKLSQFQAEEPKQVMGSSEMESKEQQERRSKQIVTKEKEASGAGALQRKFNEKEDKLEIKARKAKQSQRTNIVGQTTAFWKQKEEYQLKLLSTHETNIDWSLGFTVMPRSGDVVISGRNKGDPTSLLVFSLKDKDKKLIRRQIHLPCGHKSITKMSSLLISRQEQIVVHCADCVYLKLVDPKTGEWSTAFPDIELTTFCAGDSGTIFVQLGQGWSILQLDSTDLQLKGRIRTVHSSTFCIVMCYIPPPLDILVLGYNYKLVAMSVDRDKLVWEISGRCNDIKFDPEHNVLFVADEIKETVLIVNPENGSLIQTIKLPNMGFIYALGRYKNQLFILHHDDEGKISYERNISSFTIS